MPSGPGANSPSATRTVTPASGRTASGRYRQLGKDELLSAILGETADAAAEEEAALTRVLQQRQRDEEARRQREDEARRRLAEASREEQQRRHREGLERRTQVARQIEEEQLRLSGLWTRVQQARDVAPDTDALARLTTGELEAAAAHRLLAHHGPLEPSAPRRARRLPALALVTAASLLAGSIVFFVATASPPLDEAVYPRHTVAVTAEVSPIVDVATLAAAPPSEARRDVRSRTGRERGREGTRATSDGGDSAEDRRSAHSGERDRRAPLDISLENANQLWRVGSE
jgi:hypothetical protein